MTRQEQRTAASRSALLLAARRVLNEVGYNDATVRLITREAGRSHGTFYVHFENKEAIYATLLEEMRERLHQASRAVWRSEDPLGSLTRSIDLYVRSFQADRDLWLLLDGNSAGSTSFEEAHATLHRLLVTDIREGIDSVDTARLQGLDPNLVAQILGAMLEEACVTLLLYDEATDPDTITSHLTTLWGRVLGYAVSSSQVPADIDQS